MGRRGRWSSGPCPRPSACPELRALGREVGERRLHLDPLVGELRYPPGGEQERAPAHLDQHHTTLKKHLPHFRRKQYLPELFANRPFSRLVVASFNPETSTSWIRYGTLALAADLKPIIFGETVERIDLDHEKTSYRFGEKDYAERMLATGVLARQFRDPGTLRFFGTREAVRDVTTDRAINVAIDFIEAVSAIAGIFPAPGGIGGPVDVLLIGRDTRQRIRWKNVPG